MHCLRRVPRYITAWLLCACFVLCAGAPAAAESLFEPAGSRGSGTIDYLPGVSRLSGEQEELLLEYMHAYYLSLVRLEALDAREFYAADAHGEAEYDLAIWEVLVGIRAMQNSDLSLTGYGFALRISSVTKQADGSTRVMAFEDSSQRFAAYPDTLAQCFDMGHSYEMKQTTSGWRLTEHRQGDSLHTVLMDRSELEESTGVFSTPAFDQRDAVLAQASRDVGRRATRGSGGAKAADNPYNRQAAVKYALRWIKNRNSSNWPTYDRYGGNCQNFVSQALWASGIPMDTTEPGLWKWYGHTPNNTFATSGRSATWSGVAEFLTYVRQNRGYGLVARADAPYYSGEVGDIVHMGTASAWKHTVIITEVLRDDSGQVVDYLVASNTANLKDFPVSAYYYTNQMLIKVYGWNDHPGETTAEPLPDQPIEVERIIIPAS